MRPVALQAIVIWGTAAVGELLAANCADIVIIVWMLSGSIAEVPLNMFWVALRAGVIYCSAAVCEFTAANSTGIVIVVGVV